MNKVLGIITARGGSKGIPGKNIKLLAGKPLITYTIEAAKNSGIFDPAVGGVSRLILSTDDPAIAEVAKKYGCEVPFMRLAELAKDTTPHLPVIQHAVKWLKDNENYVPDYVAILQPTAPLRQPWHLKEAFEMLQKSGADSVVSLSEIPGHNNPMWAVKVENGLASLLVTNEPLYKRISRRQSLPPAYTQNGAVYIFKTGLLNTAKPNLYGEKTAGYVMDKKYSINIDTLEDWSKAEKLLKPIANSQ